MSKSKSHDEKAPKRVLALPEHTPYRRTDVRSRVGPTRSPLPARNRPPRRLGISAPTPVRPRFILP